MKQKRIEKRKNELLIKNICGTSSNDVEIIFHKNDEIIIVISLQKNEISIKKMKHSFGIGMNSIDELIEEKKLGIEKFKKVFNLKKKDTYICINICGVEIGLSKFNKKKLIDLLKKNQKNLKNVGL